MLSFTSIGHPILGEKYEVEKERKNNPKKRRHFVLQQRLRAALALRSDQNPGANHKYTNTIIYKIIFK